MMRSFYILACFSILTLQRMKVNLICFLYNIGEYIMAHLLLANGPQLKLDVWPFVLKLGLLCFSDSLKTFLFLIYVHSPS